MLPIVFHFNDLITQLLNDFPRRVKEFELPAQITGIMIGHPAPGLFKGDVIQLLVDGLDNMLHTEPELFLEEHGAARAEGNHLPILNTLHETVSVFFKGLFESQGHHGKSATE